MILRNKRGSTLVELIVVMLIASIIMGATAGILLTSSNVFTKNAASTEVKLMGDGIYSQISRSLVLANNLQVITSPGSAAQDKIAYRVDTTTTSASYGHLLYKKNGDTVYTDLFGSEYYKSYRVAVNARAYGQYLLDLVVIVYDKNSIECYRTGSTIEVINLKLNALSITDGSGNSLNMASADTNPILAYTLPVTN